MLDSDIVKLYIKRVMNFLVKNIIKIFFFRPIRKDQILFLSFDGKQYSDSPKYLSEYIMKNSDKKIIWAFNNPDNFSYLQEYGYEIINRNSLHYIKLITSVGTVITNNFINTYIPVRKKQIILNTWHGGSPLKTVGFADENTTIYDEFFFKEHNKKYSAFLSSSQFMTNDVFRKSFKYDGEILEYGMPRNELLLKEHEFVKKKVYQYYGVEDHKKILVLYAPTFRGTANSPSFLDESKQFDVDKCIETLEKRFNKEVIFLFRSHHSIEVKLLGSNYIMATHYPDMQELLCACGVLITDYSSCMGDMALMKKPIFLYIPDVDEYISKRGFYWDIYSLPFAISKTNEELNDSIINFNQNNYTNGVDEYFKRLETYENSESIEKTVNWLKYQWKNK